jgi:hypothetical protein
MLMIQVDFVELAKLVGGVIAAVGMVVAALIALVKFFGRGRGGGLG